MADDKTLEPGSVLELGEWEAAVSPRRDNEVLTVRRRQNLVEALRAAARVQLDRLAL
jgi:hypothetical protein